MEFPIYDDGDGYATTALIRRPFLHGKKLIVAGDRILSRDNRSRSNFEVAVGLSGPRFERQLFRRRVVIRMSRPGSFDIRTAIFQHFNFPIADASNIVSEWPSMP